MSLCWLESLQSQAAWVVLPEIIIDGLSTARSKLSVRQPEELARAIVRVLDSPGYYLDLARNAQILARRMAADERLGEEVRAIYSHFLKLNAESPSQFDAMAFLCSHLGIWTHGLQS